MASNIKLPNFLIIGVQKAGTTSIYNYLKQHPQIYMSPVKEPNFLEKDWSKYLQDNPNIIPNPKKIDTWEKYCQLFADVKDEIAIGEASPNYLFHYQSSSQLIKHYLSEDIKLIAILRNPTDRAYSDYLMHIRDDIGYRSLEEQLRYSANKSYSLLKGLYYEPLKYYFEQFGKDKVKVYLYDDFTKNPITMIQNIYQFLEVDANFNPDLSQKYQTAKIPKSQSINTLLKNDNPIRNFAASILKKFLSVEKRQQIREALINFNSQNKKALPLTPELRQKLTDYYRDDILKLQELLERDLSGWLFTI